MYLVFAVSMNDIEFSHVIKQLEFDGSSLLNLKINFAYDTHVLNQFGQVIHEKTGSPEIINNIIQNLFVDSAKNSQQGEILIKMGYALTEPLL